MAVALVALLGRVPFGGEPFGLACLLEQAPPFGQGGLGLRATLARAGQAVAIVFELRQREFSLIERRLGMLHGQLGDLEAAGIAIPARVQVVERLVELLPGPAGAAIGAADRGLEPISKRALVA